ncbi:YesK family protein [Paenibacillus senegalensis]|uniref:YesK family protein n=1 Tax=Paenibacillus senegalensis TaxID=1465766 RepID=UPI0002883035|nr:YesK family protein [Paenibacillus senegalensis]
MTDIILISIAVLILLLVLSYTIYKKFPHKKPIMYIPSIFGFIASLLLFVISLIIGKFEGMGLGVISIGAALASLLALMVAAVLDYFSKESKGR